MNDIDPDGIENLADLTRCLARLRARAGKPSLREIQERTKHAHGLLPGTQLRRAPLGRTAISDVLKGSIFPNKDFLLTLLEALDVDLAADQRWARAWVRLADPDQPPSPAAEAAARLRQENADLRQENEEVRRQLAEANAPRAGDPPGRSAARRGEQAPGEEPGGSGAGVIRERLAVSPIPTMGDLMEWRQAIEPPAAALAARRPYAPACRDLITLSRRLHELGDTSEFVDNTPAGQRVRADYEDVDARFHEALLEASGNEMFSAQRDPVREALSYRIRREWEGIYGPGSAPGGVRRFPIRPAPLSLWLHQALATAIAQAQAGAAMRFVRAILAEVDSGTLSASEADELAGALAQLDQRDADWEPFRHAIRAAVQSPRASAAMPGPVVVMGVAGCGKTTMGLVLAGALHVPYAEGDKFHSARNRDRMAQGIALTDADRAAWLAAIASHLRQDARVVASCSALKRAYRDRLREAHPGTWFLHLTVNDETAAGRVAGRDDHYMPASLVGSQFADLEPLAADEAGLAVDGGLPREQILAIAASALAGTAGPGQ